jgi:hypothetical protein
MTRRRRTSRIVACATNARGRPSKLDPVVRERLVKALGAGNRVAVAADYAGVSRSSVYRWLASDDPTFRDLQNDVENARATTEVRVVANLVSQTRRSTRAIELWLSRSGSPEWRGICPNCGFKLGVEPTFGPEVTESSPTDS